MLESTTKAEVSPANIFTVDWVKLTKRSDSECYAATGPHALGWSLEEEASGFCGQMVLDAR